MYWSEEKIENLNIIEIAQDTSFSNWYLQGLAEYASFFYLLHWKSEGIFKFGYKLSRNAFKKDYARFNHKTPDHSKIWLAIETNRKFKPKYIEKGSRDFPNYMKEHETIIHRNLKANFKKIKFYKEVYLAKSTEAAEELIKRSLVDFNINNYQNYSNERTKEAVKKFSI